MERFSYVLCVDGRGRMGHHHAMGCGQCGPDASAAYAGTAVTVQLRGEIWFYGADNRPLAISAVSLPAINHHAVAQTANA